VSNRIAGPTKRGPEEVRREPQFGPTRGSAKGGSSKKKDGGCKKTRGGEARCFTK